MQHMVITVGCEYGSGGTEIGKRIAEALGIEYYDRDLVDKVVDKLGVEEDLVREADEKTNVKFSFETQYGPRYANLTNKVAATQSEVISKLAEQDSCVIIGRCSNYILRDRKDTLNVFIYAPFDVRVQTVMEREGLSKEDAEEKVRYNDQMLHVRYKYLTGSYRGDRHERHMLIDSSLLGWEETAEYILQLIDLRFFRAR